MRTNQRTLIVICLGLSLTACAPAMPTPSATATGPASAATEAQTGPAPAATPDAPGADLLRKLPKCEGIVVLSDPVTFDWPNIDERLQELQGALWGYYSCSAPQAQVAAFYRERMPKPPTNMAETNWVERTQGSVGVYYDLATLNWTYLWIVAQPNNPQLSYIIVAQTNDPVVGEC